ncbi:MAG: hypothetical protein ACLP0J_19025, partial [Solirubrobacteraceae bacterium]
NRIGWRSSAEITLAGAAATKVVATAGAGGVAVTVWGLRAYGLSGAAVADGMVCFGILTYTVYVAAVAIAGFGLWLGVFSGPAPVGLTLIPAAFAAAVIVIALSMLIVDEPVARLLERRAEHSKWASERVVAARRRRTTLGPHGVAGRAGDAQTARSVAPRRTGLLGL